MQRRLLSVLLLAGLAGCQNCTQVNVVNEPDPTQQVDEFCQRPASKVDILWVVDNSGSMTSEQNKLGDRFSAFFKELQKSLVDYHIGVVTTSLQDGIPENVNGKLRRYSGPAVQGCDGCRYLTKEVPCGNPDIVRNAGEAEADFETRLKNECPAALVFRKLVTVGNQGSAFETGLQASTLALGAIIDPETGSYKQSNGGPVIPGENSGFLRRRTGTCQPVASTTVGLDCSQADQENCAEPSLYVVYVSDEQDFSTGPSRYFYRVIEGLKGAGNEGKISASVITGWPSGAAVPTTRACEILQRRYANPAATDPDLEALDRILAQTDKGSPPCRDTTDPDMGNNSAVVGSRYIDVVCRTGGVVADICSQDYSTALNQLGADAAGLARKFTLSKWDTIDWGSDGRPLSGDEKDISQKLNCDGNEGVDGPEDRSLCVFATNLGTADRVLVPMDTVRGWRLEESTRSIRFDGSFVPKPGTRVDVKYQLKQAAQ